jgi:hypothetical protein
VRPLTRAAFKMLAVCFAITITGFVTGFTPGWFEDIANFLFLGGLVNLFISCWFTRQACAERAAELEAQRRASGYYERQQLLMQPLWPDPMAAAWLGVTMEEFAAHLGRIGNAMRERQVPTIARGLHYHDESPPLGSSVNLFVGEDGDCDRCDRGVPIIGQEVEPIRLPGARLIGCPNCGHYPCSVRCKCC